MAKFFRRLWCWITGGHTYSDLNLQCSYDEITISYRFRNSCLKCGKTNEWIVGAECIMPEPRRKSPLYVYVEERNDGE